MADGVIITPTRLAHADEILTPAALAFVAALHRRFAPARDTLLSTRAARNAEVAAQGGLSFDEASAAVRQQEWTVVRPPGDLLDRRVELHVAPVGAGMLAALNSGAQLWVADLGAITPTWTAMVGAQLDLRDARLGTVSFTHPDGDVERVRLDTRPPSIAVAPRGWWLPEPNLSVDGEPASATLVDVGLYAFHNAEALLTQGSGAYFHLPVDGRVEARLWAEIFAFIQDELGLASGSLKTTVAIGALPAAVEMDEILYELRPHMLGLSLDVERYLTSYLECLPDSVLPPVPGDALFIRAVSAQLVRTAHRRGTHAIGPRSVDYRRQADAGFDGAQALDVANVASTRAAFDEVLGDRPNQISRLRYDVVPDSAALTDLAGLDLGIDRAAARGALERMTRFLVTWLRGQPPAGQVVPAGQAELDRAQLWQWVQAGITLRDTDQRLDAELVRILLDESADPELSGQESYELARMLVETLVLDKEPARSTVLAGYDLIG
jgi:malate synthase